MNFRYMILPLLAATQLLAFDLGFSDYTGLLKRHVCAAGVDYGSLGTDPALEASEKAFSAVTQAQYDTWSKNDRIAFLINAYNLFTLSLIVDNYPLKVGIRDINAPWDKKFITLFGRSVSLNDIEHKMLRKQFKEPRIHFAVNCASISCPALAAKAYKGKTLSTQLDTAAKTFLSDVTKNKVTGTTLRLSKIFKWYGGDFKPGYGSYKAYIKKVLGLTGDYSVSFLSYDWSLNKTDSCR